MKCELIQNDMMKFFDKEINDIELKQLNKHLKDCESCNEEFEQLKSIFAIVESEKIEVPEDLEKNIMLKIENITPEKVKKSLNINLLIYLGLSVLTCIFIYLIIHHTSTHEFIEQLNENYLVINSKKLLISISKIFSMGYSFISLIVDKYYYVIIFVAVMGYGVERLLDYYLNHLKEETAR